MWFLVQVAMLALAGVLGYSLAKEKYAGHPEDDANDDAEADADEAEAPCEPGVPAQVRACYRRMNPLTLEGANEATFLLADGREITLNFGGEGGLHLHPGDRGMLTWRGMRLIRFENENGDVIGSAFYAPVGEHADE